MSCHLKFCNLTSGKKPAVWLARLFNLLCKVNVGNSGHITINKFVFSARKKLIIEVASIYYPKTDYVPKSPTVDNVISISIFSNISKKAL